MRMAVPSILAGDDLIATREFSDAIVDRSARLVLVRRPGNWSGVEARVLAKAILMSLRINLSPEAFRIFVAALYQVGREFDPWFIAEDELPWAIGLIRSSIHGLLPSSVELIPGVAAVDDLVSVLCNYRFDQPSSIDWTDQVSRALRRNGLTGAGFGLEERIEMAGTVERILSERLDALSKHAAGMFEVELEAVVAALRSTIAQRTKATRERAPEPGPGSASRLLAHEVLEISDMAAAEVRHDFEAWLGRISPIAQRLVQRRLLHLRSASPLCGMWVKSIVGVDSIVLREVRIVASGVHYRVLFTPCGPIGVPKILSFGLRRDLDQLITNARRVVHY
jgi:hypothetical protein